MQNQEFNPTQFLDQNAPSPGPILGYGALGGLLGGGAGVGLGALFQKLLGAKLGITGTNAALPAILGGAGGALIGGLTGMSANSKVQGNNWNNAVSQLPTDDQDALYRYMMTQL